MSSAVIPHRDRSPGATKPHGNPWTVSGISPALRCAIETWADCSAAPVVGQAVAIAAQRRLAELQDMLAPGRQEACFLWLEAFTQAGNYPRTPVGPQEIGKAVSGIWETCQRFVAGVWCTETRIAFQQVQRWFPMPADVYAFLAPIDARLKIQKRGCEAIVATTKARLEQERVDSQIEPPCAATTARVRSLLQSVRADLSAQNATRLKNSCSELSDREPASPAGYPATSVAIPLGGSLAFAQPAGLNAAALLQNAEQQLAGLAQDDPRRDLLMTRVHGLRRKLGQAA